MAAKATGLRSASRMAPAICSSDNRPFFICSFEVGEETYLKFRLV
jgi:hypothetical protein